MEYLKQTSITIPHDHVANPSTHAQSKTLRDSTRCRAFLSLSGAHNIQPSGLGHVQPCLQNLMSRWKKGDKLFQSGLAHNLLDCPMPHNGGDIHVDLACKTVSGTLDNITLFLIRLHAKCHSSKGCLHLDLPGAAWLDGSFS